MAQQYIRKVSVQVDGMKTISYDGTKDGGGGLRIRFNVTQGDRSTPNIANIIITNLTDATIQPAFKLGATVTLSAGYASGDQYIIFKGQIKQTRALREQVTDKVLVILATDQSTARNYAVVNKTLQANHTHYDRVMAAVEPMKQFGVSLGYIAEGALKKTKFPRGFSMFGMSKDALRDACIATGTSWSIQNGKLQILENTKPKPGGAILLNSSTGLIGPPQQTIQGIEGRALLNPNIVPGCLVRIDQKSIQRAAIDPSYTGDAKNGLIPAIAADGLYKIFVVGQDGDSRGNDFYTSFIGIANGQNISSALAVRGINTPSN